MMLAKYNEKETKKTMVFDVFHTVFKQIKDSRWRKKCKSLIKRARAQLLIQKSRRESIIRQSQADIAQLLIYGQHDDALARIEQLHNDQCVLFAYDQMENFCDCVYANLRAIGSRSTKLSDEVNEAVSSLVFAASRCGELPELHRIRMLFKQHFGNEFERVNVELQPGNFVNSHIMYNLGNNSVPDDVKLLLTSKIASEYTLCLKPQTSDEQNFMPQCQQVPAYNFSKKICESGEKDEALDSGIGDTMDGNSKGQMQASKIKDLFWRIGSKFSMPNSRNLVTFPCDSHDGSSNRTPSGGSTPIQEKAIIYLEDHSSTNEDFSGKHEANGLDSWDGSVSSQSFVKKSFAQRRDTLIKKDVLLHENQMNNRNVTVKKGLSMRNSCNEEIIEEDEEDSKPRLSYVHPKLPDYDELVATFTEYRKEYTKSNSNNRTLRKWMRW